MAFYPPEHFLVLWSCIFQGRKRQQNKKIPIVNIRFSTAISFFFFGSRWVHIPVRCKLEGWELCDAHWQMSTWIFRVCLGIPEPCYLVQKEYHWTHPYPQTSRSALIYRLPITNIYILLVNRTLFPCALKSTGRKIITGDLNTMFTCGKGNNSEEFTFCVHNKKSNTRRGKTPL